MSMYADATTQVSKIAPNAAFAEYLESVAAGADGVKLTPNPCCNFDVIYDPYMAEVFAAQQCMLVKVIAVVAVIR